ELHDLSQTNQHELLGLNVNGKEKIVQLINKVEQLQLDIQKNEQEIRQAPESIDIKFENQEIDTLTKEFGKKEVLHRALLKRLDRSYEKRTLIRNQLTRLSGSNDDSEQLKNELDYLNRIIESTTKYINKITNLKAQLISEEFS